MSNGNNDKSKGGSPDAKQDGKRPYATIELTATEVKAATDKAASIKLDPTKPDTTKLDAAKIDTKPADTKPAVSASATVPPSGAKPTTSTSSPANKSAPSVTAPSAKSGGLFQTLVAGAAGGVLTLGGLGALGLLGDNRGSEILSTRIATIENSLKTTSTNDVAAKITATQDRLARIEDATKAATAAQAQLAAEAKSLDSKLASQQPVAQAAADRIAKLEDQLKTLGEAANSDPQRGRIPALAQITSKLGDLDTALTTRTTSLKTEVSQDVEKRLAKLSETHESDRARLAQRAQSIEQTMKSVTDETTALRQSVDTLKTDLDTRIKSTAKPADIAAAVEPVTSKIASLEKNVANVVRSESDRNATAGNVLLSIELAS
ncbi:MAG: hypothetical protein HOO99_08380, partial [Hyphomicrobiaceae bacterium]|nr:hypothetical protein [Hyphomicrobiaceae bacterium]